MIIRKKGSKPAKTSDLTAQSQKKNSSVLKKGNIIKKDEQILDAENVENTNKELIDVKPEISPKKENELPQNFNEFEKIDISSIEFKERVERRRGDRRRGYRRIDERSLVSRAQQEAHNIKELASREGYQQGLKKAREEVEKLTGALSEFLGMRDEMFEKFYPHVLEISLAAAQKIIKKEVELSQDILKNIIMSTMDELSSDTQKVEIKVNSADVEFARASLPEIIEARGDGVKIIIGQDDTVEIGSCIIIANNGVIDANFKTQLNVLQNAFGIYKGGV